MSAPSISLATVVPSAPLSSLKALDETLDTLEPRIARRFLKLVQASQEVGTVDEVAKLIEEGRLLEAIALSEDVGQGVASSLEAAFVAAGLSAALVMRSQTGSLMDFDAMSPRATAASRVARARIVDHFRRGNRASGAAVLTNAARRGLTPVQAATELKAMIGLAPHQVQEMFAFRLKLEEERVRLIAAKRAARDAGRRYRGRQPMTPFQLNRVVAQRRKMKLAARARMIGHTETLRVVHEAEEALWDQAIDEGVMLRQQVIQTWLTRQDKVVRDPAHTGLQGQKRIHGIAFISGAGNLLRFPGDPRAPIGEIANCRCRLHRKVISIAQSFAFARAA